MLFIYQILTKNETCVVVDIKMDNRTFVFWKDLKCQRKIYCICNYTGKAVR